MPSHHRRRSAGRAPNVEELGLDTAGVATTRKGITVDKRLRTTNRRVYAIGDVNGLAPFTHMAGAQGALVIRNAMFRLPVNLSPGARHSSGAPRQSFA